MLNKIFKKTESPAEAKASEAAKVAQAKKDAAHQAAETAAQVSAQVMATWQPKLDAAVAANDDAALLAIANESPAVDIKLAAIVALTNEESLKLAEREFRTHDRRVHRAAKQRLEAAVAQREAREAAQKLIESAKALVNEAKIPANRLVELDRAWLALDIALLHPDQRDEFAALAADLTTLTRERGEQQLHLNRWTADAKQALLHLNVTLGDVAAGIKDRTLLQPPCDAANELLKHIPQGDGAAMLAQGLQNGLLTATQIEARLQVLDVLLTPVAVAAPVVVSVVVSAIEPDAEPAAEPAAVAVETPETSAETMPQAATVDATTGDSTSEQAVAPTAPPTEGGLHSSAALEANLQPSLSASPAPSTASAAARWHELPPIADAQIASLLNARFDQWQRAQTDARKAHSTEKRNKANEQKNAVKQERNQALAELLQQAETALAGGHLNETNKHLVAIDHALDEGAPAGALRGRIDALQAEYARLKGWQHWGGGRVRDDLVLEAEALAELVSTTLVTVAAASTASAVAEASTEPAIAPADTTVAPVEAAETAETAGTVDLSPATADAVDNLQSDSAVVLADGAAELSKLPAVTATQVDPDTAPDSALGAVLGASPSNVIAETAAGVVSKTETKPVRPEKPKGKKDKPAQAKLPPKFSVKQHADAIEKLRDRWKELDKLGGASSRSLWKRFDAALKIAYAPVAEHLAKLKAVRQENLDARHKLIVALDAVKLANTEAGEIQNFRELSHALEHFQTEWRKSGPVEHTVPHKSREKLLEKMRSSMARLETPLQEARRSAQTTREQFIVRAKALSADAAAKPQSKEIIPKIRELQTEWQQHAKTLPLARNVENALWTEFKTATDAVFTQRDAAFSARDDEFKKHRQEREALIGKLAALTADTQAAEIKRTISDVDTAWRRTGEVRRDDAAKIEARFRAARDTATKHLAGSANRVWFGVCDALNAKMSLCVEAESAAPDSEIDARWQALPVLPPVWEQSLKTRLKAVLGGNAKEVNEGTIDATLLQLESALDIPSPPASQAARRDLKLRALKAALEGKPSNAPTGTIEQLVAEAVGHSMLAAAQNERLAAVLAAVRERGHARG